MTRKARQGWHKEDIKAELRKRGWSFARLGRLYNYRQPGQPRHVLRQRWPAMEKVIADILEVQPATIWPDRYKADGTPIGTGIRRTPTFTTSAKSDNGKERGAA
jgi:Ner family transcriptional regulator